MKEFKMNTENTLTDEELLKLSIKKPAYFEKLVERYQDAFIRKAQAIVGGREEVYDIVQDTFTKIYFNAGKFSEKDGGSFRAWGYKILCNTAFTYYQKFKKDAHYTQVLDTEILENTLVGDDRESIEKAYFEREVLVLVSQLPRNLSKILRLHYLEGVSHKDIAKEEGVSVSAIKTRIHRAKKNLKELSIYNRFIEGVYEK